MYINLGKSKKEGKIKEEKLPEKSPSPPPGSLKGDNIQANASEIDLFDFMKWIYLAGGAYVVYLIFGGKVR